jgi:small-conductance mechanosensitive channel
MDKLWSDLTQTVTDRVVAYDILKSAAQIILLFIIAKITTRVLIKLVNRFFNLRAVKVDRRRRNTLVSLLDNVIRYTVYIIFFMMVLSILGFHIETLLAGAGIAGVALGFGAQSIIKDVLTGFFILFEDQYGVGDVVQINNFTGTVSTIGLRLTRIQAWTGEIEIIPNGQVQQVRNFSKSNSVAVIDVAVRHDTNLDHALRTLRQVMERVQEESSDVVGDVQILGVQALNQTGVVLRVTVVCLPTTNSVVQRLANQRIKEAFDAEGLQMPFPQTVGWMQSQVSQAAKPEGSTT